MAGRGGRRGGQADRTGGPDRRHETGRETKRLRIDKVEQADRLGRPDKEQAEVEQADEQADEQTNR